MPNAAQKIAVIEDGKIIDIYPKEVYDAKVSSYCTPSFDGETLTSIKTTIQDSSQYQAQIGQALHQAVGYATKKYKPFFEDPISILTAAFAFVVIAVYLHKMIIGRLPSRLLFHMILAVAIALCSVAVVKLLR